MPVNISNQFIEPLEKLAVSSEQPHLIPEINKAIESGKARVFYQGDFMAIIKPKVSLSKTICWIWVGVSLCHDNVFAYNSLENMIKRAGFSHIQFETKRKGFERVAIKHGYRKIGIRDNFTIYDKEI